MNRYLIAGIGIFVQDAGVCAAIGIHRQEGIIRKRQAVVGLQLCFKIKKRLSVTVGAGQQQQQAEKQPAFPITRLKTHLLHDDKFITTCGNQVFLISGLVCVVESTGGMSLPLVLLF